MAARWTDSTIRTEPLKPYADATLDKTMELLEQALSADAKHELPSQVRQRLGSGGSRDLDELRPHLKAQSDDLIARATADLRTRGDREAAEMRAILETQRLRIQKTAVEKDLQQPGLFDQDERRQLEADKRHWQKRLDEAPCSRCSSSITSFPLVRYISAAAAAWHDPIGRRRLQMFVSEPLATEDLSGLQQSR